MKRIALAAVLLVLPVGPARAGFDEGLAAYERGDYATALKEFRPLAKRALPESRTISVSCTILAEASRGTLSKPRCGATSR